MTVYIPYGYDGSMDFGASAIRYNPIMVVAFDANGGELANDELECRFHTMYGALPVPSREGYVFNGWCLNGRIVSADTKVESTDDHTLVAQWIPMRAKRRN